MQISNQLVNTAFSRSSTTRTRVCFCFRFFHFALLLCVLFFIYIVNFLIAFFSLFLHRSFLSSPFLNIQRIIVNIIARLLCLFLFCTLLSIQIILVISYVSIVIRCHIEIKKRGKKQLHINYLFYDQCIICKCKNITTSFFNPVISFSLSVGPVQVICAGALAVLMGSH